MPAPRSRQPFVRCWGLRRRLLGRPRLFEGHEGDAVLFGSWRVFEGTFIVGSVRSSAFDWAHKPDGTRPWPGRVKLCVLLGSLLLGVIPLAYGNPSLVQLNSAQLWQRLEFQVTNVPAATNPFDPENIRLDATFGLPSGRTMTVPAFWYQGYGRSLSGGHENDTPTGSPGWRLRFTPPEAGAYSLQVLILTNGQPSGSPLSAAFNVPPGSAPSRYGYVGIAPGNRYFQTGDGQGAAAQGRERRLALRQRHLRL